MKQISASSILIKYCSAAFGRLCVETPLEIKYAHGCLTQPPSGGCVLKLCMLLLPFGQQHQPPSGGCVLKHCQSQYQSLADAQPPSGGCVLKRLSRWRNRFVGQSAAFGRLCVETSVPPSPCHLFSQSAAFGRLCVETSGVGVCCTCLISAAFGRLCVETDCQTVA